MELREEMDRSRIFLEDDPLPTEQGGSMELRERMDRARILVVDDQLPNVKLLEKLLRSEGFMNVTSTTDPREAVRLYQEQPYDLMLLDIRMPHLDGYQVMQACRSKGEPAPVIVLTAQTDRETRIQALQEGARDFLTKPFDHLEVISRIRNHLEIHLLHAQVRDQNRLLEERVRERTQALNDTRLDIIRRLGRASEFRDNETGLHIIRMSKYAEAIARSLCEDDALCEILLNAAPMHDIGKLGIPDSILLKPGRLTVDEFTIMKTHTLIGADLLEGEAYPLLSCARRIALCHHEKWDGSGYPRGLAGSDIPLEARVCAISDVFDALVSVRPYKKAWSEEEAIAEINRSFGTHFDPGLQHHFLQALPEILEIKREFADPE